MDVVLSVRKMDTLLLNVLKILHQNKKKCMEMGDFVDNWSVIDNEDECSYVYILFKMEDTVKEEGLDTSQK